MLATVLKEDEESVVVEESFPPKASPVDQGEGASKEAPESSSSNGLDKWLIKLEQSVNVLLTVNLVFLSCRRELFTSNKLFFMF